MENNIFDLLLENIENTDVIDNYIKILVDTTNINYIVEFSYNNLNNITFVSNILNKLNSYFNDGNFSLQNSLLLMNLSVSKIKNLLLLESINEETYYTIFFAKKLPYQDLFDILSFLLLLGKLDEFIDSNKSLSRRFNIKLLPAMFILDILNCFIDFHKIVIENKDDNIYKSYTSFLIDFITIDILTILEGYVHKFFINYIYNR